MSRGCRFTLSKHAYYTPTPPFDVRQLRQSKAEAENLVEAVKNDLREARLDIRKAWAECEAERTAARRNGAAARDAEEELKRSNARAEEAYGKVWETPGDFLYTKLM